MYLYVWVLRVRYDESLCSLFNKITVNERPVYFTVESLEDRPQCSFIVGCGLLFVNDRLQGSIDVRFL